MNTLVCTCLCAMKPYIWYTEMIKCEITFMHVCLFSVADSYVLNSRKCIVYDLYCRITSHMCKFLQCRHEVVCCLQRPDARGV